MPIVYRSNPPLDQKHEHAYLYRSTPTRQLSMNYSRTCVADQVPEIHFHAKKATSSRVSVLGVPAETFCKSAEVSIAEVSTSVVPRMEKSENICKRKRNARHTFNRKCCGKSHGQEKQRERFAEVHLEERDMNDCVLGILQCREAIMSSRT